MLQPRVDYFLTLLSSQHYSCQPPLLTSFAMTDAQSLFDLDLMNPLVMSFDNISLDQLEKESVEVFLQNFALGQDAISTPSDNSNESLAGHYLSPYLLP